MWLKTTNLLEEKNMKKLSFVLGLLIIASMLLVACAPAAATEAPAEEAPAEEAPAEEAPAEEAPAAEPLKACLVTDSAGIGDRSFNDMVWKGLEKAKTDLGIEASYIESKSADDYAPNLAACVDSEAQVVVCVGFMMADACAVAAEANPDVKFIGVDITWLTYPNFLGVDAYMDQSCFQAGYLAAGMTKTGKVATFTGIFGPVVQIFMDGFYMGVQEYNKVHGTSVQVLGYDPKNMDQASATGSWSDIDLGRQFGESFINNGADIILPVAGFVGGGTAAAIKDSGIEGYIFGVDQDWTQTVPEYKDLILGSALKNMDVPVFNAIKDLVEADKWTSGNYVLQFSNNGTALAWNDSIAVPAELKAEVDALKDKIMSGEISSVSPEYLAKYPRQ
jgi:basic membrane protein A